MWRMLPADSTALPFITPVNLLTPLPPHCPPEDQIAPFLFSLKTTALNSGHPLCPTGILHGLKQLRSFFRTSPPFVLVNLFLCLFRLLCPPLASSTLPWPAQRPPHLHSETDHLPMLGWIRRHVSFAVEKETQKHVREPGPPGN